MSVGRSMKYVMHMADRYAKACGARKKQSQIDYLRNELERALLPIVSSAQLFKDFEVMDKVDQQMKEESK